jgi:hypothetical protein
MPWLTNGLLAGPTSQIAAKPANDGDPRMLTRYGISCGPSVMNRR